MKSVQESAAEIARSLSKANSLTDVTVNIPVFSCFRGIKRPEKKHSNSRFDSAVRYELLTF